MIDNYLLVITHIFSYTIEKLKTLLKWWRKKFTKKGSSIQVRMYLFLNNFLSSNFLTLYLIKSNRYIL